MIFGSMYSKTVQLGALVITFWTAIFQKHRGIWNFPGIIIRHFCLKKKLETKWAKKIALKMNVVTRVVFRYSTLQISMHFRGVHEAKWLIFSFDSFDMKSLNSSIFIFSYHMASEGTKVQLKYSQEGNLTAWDTVVHFIHFSRGPWFNTILLLKFLNKTLNLAIILIILFVKFNSMLFNHVLFVMILE